MGVVKIPVGVYFYPFCGPNKMVLPNFSVFGRVKVTKIIELPGRSFESSSSFEGFLLPLFDFPFLVRKPTPRGVGADGASGSSGGTCITRLLFFRHTNDLGGLLQPSLH